MTDPRRDVARKLLNVGCRLEASTPLGAPSGEEYETALDEIETLLREPSEGREPDAVIAAEGDFVITECFGRGTAAWHQYVHGGNRTDWLPAYFGTPSDSPAEKRCTCPPPTSAYQEHEPGCARASDSPTTNKETP